MKNFRRHKWWIVTVLISAPLAALATQVSFTTGTPIVAADVNGNFTELYGRVGTLETNAAGAFNVLDGVSSVLQSGTIGADLIYTQTSVALTPGTWLVEAYATVSTQVAETIELGLFDATHAIDVLNARGGLIQTLPNTPVPLHTSRVITVTATTTIQIKGYRNGASMLTIGRPTGIALDGGVSRLMAVRLK